MSKKHLYKYLFIFGLFGLIFSFFPSFNAIQNVNAGANDNVASWYSGGTTYKTGNGTISNSYSEGEYYGKEFQDFNSPSDVGCFYNNSNTAKYLLDGLSLELMPVLWSAATNPWEIAGINFFNPSSTEDNPFLYTSRNSFNISFVSGTRGEAGSDARILFSKGSAVFYGLNESYRPIFKDSSLTTRGFNNQWSEMSSEDYSLGLDMTGSYEGTASVLRYVTLSFKKVSGTTYFFTFGCDKNGFTSRYPLGYVTGYINASSFIDGNGCTCVSIWGHSYNTESTASTDVSMRIVHLVTGTPTYTLTVDQNGGSGASGNISFIQPRYEMKFDIGQPSKTGYTFSKWTPSGCTVSGNRVTIGANIQGDCSVTAAYTINTYSATASAGTGYTFAFLSTNSSATSGSPSGTKFNYDSTVYAFYSLNTGYSNNGLTKKGSYYRTDGKKVTTSGASFSSGNATPTQYTLTITTGGNISSMTAKVKTNGIVGNRVNTSISSGGTIYHNETITVTFTAKTGYHFGDNQSTTTTTKDYTVNAANLTATYSDVTSVVNTYTLTANANGGSISSTSGWNGTGSTATKSINYGAQYSTLPSISRTGYTFSGWFTASSGGTNVSSTTTMGASNANIYAQWSPFQATMQFNSNGGSGTMSNQSIQCNVNFTIPSNAFTKTGYKFDHWEYTSPGGVVSQYSNGQVLYSDNSSNPSHEIFNICTQVGNGGTATLKAIWSAKTYTVTLNGNNGTSTHSSVTATYDSLTLKSNGTAVTPKASRTGYTFSGFYTASSNGTKIIDSNGALVASVSGYTDANRNWKKDGNVTLYAQWSAKTYTLTLNGNGGTSDYDSLNVTYDNRYFNNDDKIQAMASRDGYLFKGYWTSETGGSKIISDSGNLRENVSGYTDANRNWKKDGGATLYAHWESGESGALTIVTTFNSNCGCKMDGSTNLDTLKEAWRVSSNSYSNSEEYIQYWFKNEFGDTMSEFIRLYRYIYEKYGSSPSFNDYLGLYTNSDGTTMTFTNNEVKDYTKLFTIVGVAAITTIIISIIKVRKKHIDME